MKSKSSRIAVAAGLVAVGTFGYAFGNVTGTAASQGATESPVTVPTVEASVEPSPSPTPPPTETTAAATEQVQAKTVTPTKTASKPATPKPTSVPVAAPAPAPAPVTPAPIIRDRETITKKVNIYFPRSFTSGQTATQTITIPNVCTQYAKVSYSGADVIGGGMQSNSMNETGASIGWYRVVPTSAYGAINGHTATLNVVFTGTFGGVASSEELIWEGAINGFLVESTASISFVCEG